MIKLNMSGHVNPALEEMGYINLGLHVDLADPELPNKIAEILTRHISSGDTVTVSLPGLAPLAAIVLATIHGLSGHFPKVIALVRQSDGSFQPCEPFDLQGLRNDVARKKHRDQGDLVVL